MMVRLNLSRRRLQKKQILKKDNLTNGRDFGINTVTREDKVLPVLIFEVVLIFYEDIGSKTIIEWYVS